MENAIHKMDLTSNRYNAMLNGNTVRTLSAVRLQWNVTRLISLYYG